MNRLSDVDRELLANLAGFRDEVAELNTILKTITARSIYQRVRFWAVLAAAMTFHIGIVLGLGGARRVSAHAYEIIGVYGGPIVWGCGFMAAGLFTGCCVAWWHRILRWALLAEAVPYAATSMSFAIASIKYDDVILIAAPMFAWVMIMHAFLSDYARKEF